MERDFARESRFRRLLKNYERLPEKLVEKEEVSCPHLDI